MAHVIKAVQGETIPHLAEQYEIRDWYRIWDAPQNAELRAIRDPMILAPGDNVFIPDPEPKSVSARAGSTVRYTVKRRKPVFLRLVVHGVDGKELPKGTWFTLEVGTLRIRHQLDEGGLLVVEVPYSESRATLYIDNYEYELDLGHLDPIETVRGWWARLVALGFLADAPQTIPSENAIRAVLHFQLHYKLKADGIVGPETTRKLKQVYGC